MKNLGLRSFSLMLAILLALFVRRESNNLDTSFGVPYEISNVPPDKVIIKRSINQPIIVSIRGTALLVRKIQSSSHSFKIKLPEGIDSHVNHRFSPSDLDIPSSVQVLSIDPPSIQLTLDDRISKTVPVVVPHIGKASASVKIDSISTTPETVVLNGAASDLRSVSSVQTDPIDLHDIQGNVEREVKVRIPGAETHSNVENIKVVVKVSLVAVEPDNGLVKRSISPTDKVVSKSSKKK